MLDRLSDAEMLNLRIGEDLIDRIDRSAGDAGAVEYVDPLGAGALRRVVLERGVEHVAVGGSCLLRGVACVGLELRGAEGSAQAGKMCIARGGDVDVPVTRTEHPGRNSGRMVVTGLRRDLAGNQPAHRLE